MYKDITINLIAAMDLNRLIGVDNKLPWPKLKYDMQRFKELTTNNIVLMGRKTFESIGSKPLPKRINQIISKQGIQQKEEWLNQECYQYDSIERALGNADRFFKCRELWVIGGSAIYKHFLDNHLVDNIYLTLLTKRIDSHRKDATLFPELYRPHCCDLHIKFEMMDFELLKAEKITNDILPYWFLNYSRIRG